jgi:hypothetical protein
VAAAPGNQYRSVVRSPPPAATAAYVKERISRAAAKQSLKRVGAGDEAPKQSPLGRAPTAPANSQVLGTRKKLEPHQRYEDTAHAQQHFLSVLRDIKEKLDEFHGVPADDAAFGRHWSSCAVVRAPALLTLLTPHHENAVCRAPFCRTLFR